MEQISMCIIISVAKRTDWGLKEGLLGPYESASNEKTPG